MVGAKRPFAVKRSGLSDDDEFIVKQFDDDKNDRYDEHRSNKGRAFSDDEA